MKTIILVCVLGTLFLTACDNDYNSDAAKAQRVAEFNKKAAEMRHSPACEAVFARAASVTGHVSYLDAKQMRIDVEEACLPPR